MRPRRGAHCHRAGRFVKLLANENIPLPAVGALRAAGHDVLAIAVTTPGLPDEAVLALARREARTLLTLDRDYGTLIYRHRLPGPPALIYLRFRPRSPVEPAEVLQPLLSLGESQLRGYFHVLDREACRRRPWPDQP